MGQVGYAPTPSVFQADASTKLASPPLLHIAICNISHESRDSNPNGTVLETDQHNPRSNVF